MLAGWKSALEGRRPSSVPTPLSLSYGCHLCPLLCCTKTCPETCFFLQKFGLTNILQTSGSRSVIQLDLRLPPNRKGKTQGLPCPGPPWDVSWLTFFFLGESNDEIIKVLRTIHSVICHINSKSIPMSKTFIKQDRYILYIELLEQLKTCLVTESSTGNAILFI